MKTNKIPHCRDNSKIKSNRAEIDISFPRDFLFILCFEKGSFECNWSRTTAASSGAGIAYTSRAPAFTTGF